MSTFNELVYMIMDQNKIDSDDSFIEPDHIVFMLSKIRAYFLKDRYGKAKAQIPQSNFQTISLELEPVEDIPSCFAKGIMVKSKKQIPDLLLLDNYEGITQVNVQFGVPINFSFVNNSRFNTVGFDKWQIGTTYATIGPDHYLYLKSNNSDLKFLEKVNLTSIFEDAQKANELVESSNCETSCSIMDNPYPLEEGLITPVLQMVGEYVYGSLIKPADTTNNASDDMSNLNRYLARITKEKYK